MVHAAHEASITIETTAEGSLADSKGGDGPRAAWPFGDTERDPPRSMDAKWAPRPIHMTIEEMLPPEAIPPEKVKPNVRREESVIAELAQARSGSLHRAAAQIKEAVDVLHDSSRSALRRFESLPREKQIMWVAAPYVGAAFLVGLLLAFDAGGDGPVEITPVTPAIAETLAPPIPTPTPEIARLAPTAPLTTAGPIAKETHQLPIRATLYARPDGELKIAQVRPQLLTIYPDFPAAEGWVLVMTEKGTVGYLEKARLEGEPEPSKKGKKKKVRPRRRK